MLQIDESMSAAYLFKWQKNIIRLSHIIILATMSHKSVCYSFDFQIRVPFIPK